MLTGINHAADANAVADLVTADIGAHGGDLADDLVTRHQRVDGNAPFIAGLMDIGVAHTTVENLDRHIVRAQGAALEGHGGEGGGSGLGGVTDSCVHNCLCKAINSECWPLSAGAGRLPIVIPPPVMPKAPYLVGVYVQQATKLR
ncbi:hypothetical protein D3C84_958230 [compost metagenome]